MGLDPSHPDYEPGEPCPDCVDYLFDGVTPKYVEVDLSGITACPGIGWDLPNGTYLMTQLMNPCWWYFGNVDIQIWWKISGVSGYFEAWHGVRSWFHALPLIPCCDAFVNDNVCGVWPACGKDGYAVVWWGPMIGP